MDKSGRAILSHGRRGCSRPLAHHLMLQHWAAGLRTGQALRLRNTRAPESGEKRVVSRQILPNKFAKRQQLLHHAKSRYRVGASSLYSAIGKSAFNCLMRCSVVWVMLVQRSTGAAEPARTWSAANAASASRNASHAR